MTTTRTLSLLFLLAIGASNASAACMNRFVTRTERPRQIVTLLTGKLTFQEAQTLAEAINRKQAPALEWVTPEGKTIAKQYGELKIVRPMPVGCDGKTSGVVLVAIFAAQLPPEKKMYVKLNADTTVVFDQQGQ
ncbi:MAG: hypothetical protein ABI779_11685 [Acidobacteriota bacterium]